MYAARPAGESLVAKATEWGRVAENKQDNTSNDISDVISRHISN